MSIHLPILRRLLTHPRRVAVVDDRRSYSGLELVVGALHVAREIHRVSRAPHVGIMLPTSGAFPIAALAVWMLGRTVVPLNYLLKPEELEFVLKDCETDCVVTAQAMLDFLGDGARVLHPTATTPTPGTGSGGVRVIRLEDVNFKGLPPLRWPRGAADDDLGVLLYTSGTSGKPKGVMLTHGNIRSNVLQVLDHVAISSKDVVLGVLPQFHSFGLTVLTIMPLSIGAKVVYTAKFAPGKLVKLMREHRPSVFIAIPSMYNAMLHAKDASREDFASLRYVVSGGEPLPAAVQDAFFDRFGVRINEGYGLTETSPVTNWCRPEEYRRGSVGKPLGSGPIGVRERIVSIETGQDLPPGQEGEVRISGPQVMKGYFKREEESRAIFDDRGWLRTGDIGRFDADGHLFITGRLKEMLIVGGENVFPREIEEVLNAHPSIKESGVVGRKDPMRGEIPVAFVELKEGAAFDEKAVLKWCRERLAGYKVPDEIRVLESLPRNPTGKVLRRELKALL